MKKLKKRVKRTGNAVEAYACACLCSCTCLCSCSLLQNKTTQQAAARTKGSSQTAQYSGVTHSA